VNNLIIFTFYFQVLKIASIFMDVQVSFACKGNSQAFEVSGHIIYLIYNFFKLDTPSPLC
jgi:hypothetical protein